MWTPELVARLKKYVDSRSHLVYYASYRVCSVDIILGYPIEQSVFLLHDRPGLYNLSDTNPSEFSVFTVERVKDWHV